MAKAKRNLVLGNTFNLAEYEPMAMIDSVTEGMKVVVVSNNSSHFLVAIQSPEDWETSTRNCNMATLMQSFTYVGDDNEAELDSAQDMRLRQAYRSALTAAVTLAMASR